MNRLESQKNFKHWNAQFQCLKLYGCQYLTNHSLISDKRIASKFGVGKFSNVYGISGNNVTAGQKDYAARMMQIEKQREEYYKSLGTPPGVLTMKGATADPDNTHRGYNDIIGDLGDHSVSEGWVQRPKFNEKGDVPGPPVQWQKPKDPDNAQPGYGYIPTDTTNIEDIFFYHSDHLGSTSYITDAKANITRFDAYLPYGELLVDEHTSSEDMPYKFNGKELDQETGLDYYGARYMNPITSIWYGVDPLAEKYIQTSAYIYGGGNPIRIIDPNGMGWVETEDKKAYWDERVNSAEDTKFIPKGGRFLGSTADLFDEHGEYKFDDDQGNILSAHPLENVIVTGDKEYKFYQTFGYKIFGDFRNSDGGLGPWDPDAVSFGVGGNITFVGTTIGLEIGMVFTGGKISPYCTFYNMGLTYQGNHYQAQIGIRYENTRNSFQQDTQKTEQNSSQFLPYASLSFSLGNISHQISFKYDMQRPPLGFIGGYSYYLNRYKFQEGNPVR